MRSTTRAATPELDFEPDSSVVLSGAQEIALMEAERARSGSFTGWQHHFTIRVRKRGQSWFTHRIPSHPAGATR